MIAIEEFGYNIKFSESERKNESQFALSEAAEVEDVINSLLNAVKSATEIIRKSLLEVHNNLGASYSDA